VDPFIPQQTSALNETYPWVFLHDANSLLKEVRKYGDAVFLGNKHDGLVDLMLVVFCASNTKRGYDIVV
jgi:hypothetical protein